MTTFTGVPTLPRKPNFKFERLERERAKAQKKAARLEAKAERRTPKDGEVDVADGDATDDTTAEKAADSTES